LTIDKLHCCMGHVSHSAARVLVWKKLMSGIELDESSKPSVCESCKWVKGVQKEIQRTCNGDRTAAVGDEVHLDLWRSAPVETINQKEYYISFTNDHSCFTHLFLLHTKDQAFDAYVTYKALLKTQNNI